MTCKDCIHKEVCNMMLEDYDLGELNEDYAENCRCFTDKSKYVNCEECKIFDTLEECQEYCNKATDDAKQNALKELKRL